MKHKDMEVPGNALATAALTERLLSRTGHRVHMAAYAMSQLESDGITIKRITFKCSGGVAADWLAIITASTENGGIVAFHSGDGLVGTMEGAFSRISNGSLKWKEDEYANEGE